MSETPEMDRGRFARPTRHGDEVHRRPRHRNPDAHRFLEFLAKRGFVHAPRFLGFARDGAERLTYLEGRTGYPPYPEPIRSETALASATELVRAFHDASQGFEFSEDFRWHGYEWARPAMVDCVGHFDLAPWNLVFHGDRATGILDWDTLGPSSRVWDLAYLAYHLVPFHPAEDLANWGWKQEPNRRFRLRLLTSHYGLDISPHEIVDSAVQRIYGIGGYLDQQVRAGNPDYDVHAREGHAAAYFKAAASLIAMRDALV